MATINVLYTCDKCMTYKRAVRLEEASPEESLAEFMDRVARALKRDHDVISSACVITHFTEVFIPIAKDGRVGQVD